MLLIYLIKCDYSVNNILFFYSLKMSEMDGFRNIHQLLIGSTPYLIVGFKDKDQISTAVENNPTPNL